GVEAANRERSAGVRPRRGGLGATGGPAGPEGTQGRAHLPPSGHGPDGARDQPRRPRPLPRPRGGPRGERHRPLHRPARLLDDGGAGPRKRLRPGDARAAPRPGPGGLPGHPAGLGRPGQPRVRRPQHRSRRRHRRRGRAFGGGPFVPGRGPRRGGARGARRPL
ncbi:MAG: hypothetical protein AVDCRST_MAG02-4099, partial [uncultured Rubrobacteraceae bacterium]